MKIKLSNSIYKIIKTNQEILIHLTRYATVVWGRTTYNVQIEYYGAEYLAKYTIYSQHDVFSSMSMSKLIIVGSRAQ